MQTTQPNRRKGIWSWILFLAGFVVANAQQFPGVEGLFCADLAWLERAVKSLTLAQPIKRGSEDFEKIERLLIDDFTSPNSKFRSPDYPDNGDVKKGIESLESRFMSSEVHGSYLNQPDSKKQVRANLVGGGRIIISFFELRKHYETGCMKRKQIYSAIFLVLGFVTAAIGFLRD